MSTESAQPRPRPTRRARLIFLAGLIVGLLGVMVYRQASRRPAGPQTGTQLIQVDVAGPQPFDRDIFRIGTYNIHGGKDLSGNDSLSRIAMTLDGLDVAGLNEVHGGGIGSGPSDNQAGELGRLLKMPWLFAPTEQRWGSGDFGNGILCRIPVSYWQRIMLPGTEQSGYRNTLLAVMQVNHRPVRVLITHIDRSHDRIEQLSAVGQLFLSLEEPAVLMGDLNSDSSDLTLGQLLKQPGVIDAIGTGMGPNDPAGRIDWILVRGLKVRSAGLKDLGASDHPMAWAELERIAPKPAETQP